MPGKREYVCLRCQHLKQGKMDLLECELQVVRYLKEDRSSWCMDPVCIHDAEVESRQVFSMGTYDTSNLTDRFQAL